MAACLLVLPAGTAAAAKRSGVLSGFVLSAPATPVCMPLVPCVRPAPGVVLTFRRADVVRARVTTGANGSYRVRLVAGTYAVKVTRPVGAGMLRPTSVTISVGQVKRVTFYLDSGIR
jgi:Carboxypeptidase regulatory-like domain